MHVTTIGDHTTEGPADASQSPNADLRPAAAFRLPETSVRAASLLRRFENGLLRVDRVVERVLPPNLNPLTQTGAIANTCFLVALVTGILLLLWYSPSLSQAYDSLAEASALGGFVRSMHRYSSDACVFFMVLHVVRVVLARKFQGPRSLAWVTGVALALLVWGIGWTGYWLVWDVRAQEIALLTARAVDVLPLFSEPISRAFLTNETVPSLLFFLVFFAHMLLPLAMGAVLWLHLSRLNRPRLMTGRAMTVWIVGATVILSLLLPAENAARADVSVQPERFTMDWWYLWPLAVSERLNGGLLWTVFLAGIIACATLPWWTRRNTRTKQQSQPSPSEKAIVNKEACQGCTLCSRDCPFDAIAMVPDTTANRRRSFAEVDPARCVACGICTGACDSDAIALPWLDPKDVRRQIKTWIGADTAAGIRPFIAFLCGESAGGTLTVDAATGRSPQLPGYHTIPVPCAGWVGAPLLEWVVSIGAEGILVVGCGHGEPTYREGAEWLERRLQGTRKPVLRRRRVDPERIQYLRLDRIQAHRLPGLADAFRNSIIPPSPPQHHSRARRIAGAIALAAVLSAATWSLSDLPYRPHTSDPEWIISFKHWGTQIADSQALDPGAEDHRPVHMRGQTEADGPRVPVRLRVFLDGELHVDSSYAPGGLRDDGASSALERIPLDPGEYDVRVQIGDTVDPNVWSHEWTGRVAFGERDRRVLLFDRDHGFQLH